MKTIFFTLLFISFILCFSQTKERDLRLVGTWEGTEKEIQEKGVDKYWVQQRFNDGTFLMLVVSVDQDGEGKSFVDKGEWWTEGEKFHKIHFNSKFIDSYFYEVYDDQHVKFILSNSDLGYSTPNYEFMETKLIEGAENLDSES